jgi:hypothetical protein
MSQVLKCYARHLPTAERQAALDRIRAAYSELHLLVEREVKAAEENNKTGRFVGSRSLSVALTNLEQSCMWATKAIVHGDVESVQG